MALLSPSESNGLIEALSKGLIPFNRDVLLSYMHPNLISILVINPTPRIQISMDVNKMNSIERLTTGEIPLQLYIQNALPYLFASPNEEKIVREYLDIVIQRANGIPAIPVDKLQETKEQIIFTDDMVPYSFMENGLKAAASVVKLRVAAFENGVPKKSNGNPMVFLGTGWFITPSLLITNHHVVNARKEGEPNVAVGDLQLQAQNIKIIPDYNSDELEQVPLENNLTLLAWDEKLDYAIMRIEKGNYKSLHLASEPILLGTDPMPVNIIQHPGGRGKRYGIRNNLVSSCTETELRYFTDTETGSSGSAVFNDKWEVVALHRASKYVSDVKYQGKTTAYINVGTPMNAIINHLTDHFAEILDEIER